jgi:hypothetical protein
MPRNVMVTLNWDLYVAPEDVPQQAGIYMVIAGRQDERGSWLTSSYKLLDIGQSGESGVRLSGHDREPCWNREKSEGSSLLYKFAPMSSEDYDETDRRIVECCLRAHTRPPCGTECNEGYNRQDSVVITNTGKPAPLRETYSCP